ncbi:MAG: hypothetical protein IPI85_06530 [Dehalococcoidia bacterium]|nr:hypothetical protein [Dehalococcoidia bacterium]
MPADLVIRNARIIDGSGAAAFPADVSISGDRITAVGTAGAGARGRSMQRAGPLARLRRYPFPR